jgi:protein-S-isoprenylcysteine O-methyltransferase Ste14
MRTYFLLIRWLAAIIILPGTVLILVPFLLLKNNTSLTIFGFYGTGLVAGLPGLFFSLWSAFHCMRHGNGTAAPWDPPKLFIASGPYRFSRNPMILGVMLLLLSEAIVFTSIKLLLWCILFTAINLLYIPLMEEKGLERRFGAEYLNYKRLTPRWIPLTFFKIRKKAG